MLAILGPAKTMNMAPVKGVKIKPSLPEFLEDSKILIAQLRKMTVQELKSLMDISDKLASSTFKQVATWKPDYPASSGKPAIMAFDGEVYNGLNVKSLKEKDLAFANEHVRILSGLYGVLRPLDSILPYRLEMGTRLENERGKNLYDFWKNIIPDEISKLTGESENKVLVNLASNEYFSSVRPERFQFRVITPVFKEEDGNEFRNVTIYAKKARGMMLRFMIKNQVTDPEQLKAFDYEKYYFNADYSTEDEWWFCR